MPRQFSFLSMTPQYLWIKLSTESRVRGTLLYRRKYLRSKFIGWVDGAVIQPRLLLRIARTHVVQTVHIHGVVQGPQATSHNSHSGVHHFEKITTCTDRALHSKTQFGTTAASPLLRFYTLSATHPQRLVGTLGEGGGGTPHPLRVTRDFDLITWTIFLLYKRNLPARHFTSQLKQTKRMLGTHGLALHP